MTKDEFRDWYAHHRAAFPGIDAWLAKMDRAARHDDDLRSADVLRTWRAVLGDTELVDARAATDAMARGDLDEPKAFDSHAKAVRRAAKRFAFDRGVKDQPAPQYVDGEPVFRCPECHDDGIVTVWHPHSMNAMANGSFGQRFTRYTCAVRCSCKAGWRYRWIKHVFDPQKMVPSNYLQTTQDEDNLRRFIEAEMSSVGSEWTGEDHAYPGGDF